MSYKNSKGKKTYVRRGMITKTCGKKKFNDRRACRSLSGYSYKKGSLGYGKKKSRKKGKKGYKGKRFASLDKLMG